MNHIALEEPVCVCEAGQVARTGPDPNCPLHGKHYKPNPGFTRNSWLQPYILRQN